MFIVKRNVTEEMREEYTSVITDALQKLNDCLISLNEGEIDNMQLNFIQKIDSIL